MKRISLNPDKSLLCPQFEGYKLYSHGGMSCYSRNFDSGIAKVQTTDAYLHNRLLSTFNYLFGDPFNKDLVFFFNSEVKVLMQSVEKTRTSHPLMVWDDGASSPNNDKYQYPPSIHFTSNNTCLISDGCGLLSYVETGNRMSGERWKTKATIRICPCIVVQSIDQKLEDSSEKLHILLHLVIDNEDGHDEEINTHIRKPKSRLNVVHWLTLNLDGNKLSIERERKLAGRGAIEYLSFSKLAEEVILFGHQEYQIFYDSSKDIVLPDTEQDKETRRCIFKQNSDELTIYLSLDLGENREDAEVVLTNTDVKILSNSDQLFYGKFSHAVEASTSTWQKVGKQLELCVMKKQEGLRWDTLFEDSSLQAEEVPDESQDEMLKTLADQLGPESSKPTYDPGQLEDCDTPQEDSMIQIFQKDSTQCIALGRLGATEHLFNKQGVAGGPPSFCVRHDVDGILFHPESDNCFEHISTFHAVGYVKAGKSLAKYTCAPHDNSYVAIIEYTSHVYVYCQDKPLGTELRNRKTGSVSTKTSAQMLISLKDHDEVMGAYCTREGIFILTDKNLSFWVLPSVA